jgi:hypothetical protein
METPRIFALKVSLIFGLYATSKWQGVIEIDSSSTLEDIHFAIQSALRFDSDHLYEFYCARTVRSRKRIIYDDENGALYSKTIESLFPLPKNQRLFYLFDYGDCWTFQVAKVPAPKVPPDSKAVYPRLAYETSKKPKQYSQKKY